MNEPLVKSILDECWDEVPDRRHRSLVTSLIVRETFGGDVHSHNGQSNSFFNHILGVDYHFSERRVSDTDARVEWPELLEQVPPVAAVLSLMREKWRHALRRRLPLRSVSHVLIQDDTANPGSYARPDFSCVVLTAESIARLNTNSFYPGQRFWLKRTNGPIVALGTLERWIVGWRSHWSAGDIRSVTHGYPIEDLDQFWRNFEAEPSRAFLVAWFTDAHEIERPVYPADVAYGRRVIDLPDYASHIAWLYSDQCLLSLPDPPEELCAPHRYRFPWEPLLNPEVSAALDERTRPHGRFVDRIEAVNAVLLDYLQFLAACDEEEVLGLFTDDQLFLLAELDELSIGEPDRLARLTRTLLELGHAGVLTAELRHDAAEMIAVGETLRRLNRKQQVVLLDLLRRVRVDQRPSVSRYWLDDTHRELEER